MVVCSTAGAILLHLKLGNLEKTSVSMDPEYDNRVMFSGHEHRHNMITFIDGVPAMPVYFYSFFSTAVSGRAL